MNFQKQPPDFVINFLKENKIDYNEIDYYAYPLTFSSTAGTGCGWGGQFTCEAYVVDNGIAAVFMCAGKIAYVTARLDYIVGYKPKQWR